MLVATKVAPTVAPRPCLHASAAVTCASLIETEADRVELAELNLKAAQEAMRATAEAFISKATALRNDAESAAGEEDYEEAIELLEESGIAEIEINEGEESVRISRYSAAAPAAPCRPP